MAQKTNFLFSIREYRPSDQHAVMSLFRDGTLEHVYPSFVKATSHQDHVGIALSFSMCWEAAPTFKLYSLAVYGSASFITIYYCCHNVYESYMMRRLSTDMADIQASYLENPDNGFWVAEVNGQPKVVGMVAVMGKTREEEGEGGDDWNGGTIQGGSEFAHEAADGSYGEMSHVVVRFPWCRKNLGSQLTQLPASLWVSARHRQQPFQCSKDVAFFKLHKNHWFFKLARITVMPLEKLI